MFSVVNLDHSQSHFYWGSQYFVQATNYSSFILNVLHCGNFYLFNQSSEQLKALQNVNKRHLLNDFFITLATGFDFLRENFFKRKVTLAVIVNCLKLKYTHLFIWKFVMIKFPAIGMDGGAFSVFLLKVK